MAKYRVLAKSFIGNTLVEEGTVVDYDGEPGPNLEPMDKQATKAAKDAGGAEARNAERLANAGKTGDPNVAVAGSVEADDLARQQAAANSGFPDAAAAEAAAAQAAGAPDAAGAADLA